MYALRSWLARAKLDGWLGALADLAIGRALSRIHDQPEARWTIASLARAAGLSRSRFSERFTALVGASPMHYATSVAMERAAELVRGERLTLDELANRFGYESAPAFAWTFKRHRGFRRGGAGADVALLLRHGTRRVGAADCSRSIRLPPLVR